MNNDFGNPTQMGQSTSPQGTTPMPVGSLAPAGRPMQQAAPVTAPVKKRKTGLIVGVVIAVLVLVGGGIAVAMVLANFNKQTPVEAAMSKLVNDGIPENVAINGNIEMTAEDPNAMVSSIKISLKSGLRPKSLINNTTATVTASVRYLGDLTVEVSEIYASGDNLFFKIDGATNAIEDSGILFLLSMMSNAQEVVDCSTEEGCQSDESTETECADGETCESAKTSDIKSFAKDSQIVLDEDTIQLFSSIIDAVELIDGEWLRITTNDISSFPGEALAQSDIGCVANLVNELNSNSNSATEFYNKYPFVSADNKNIPIESKQYPVYKVGINAKNFADFVNSIRGTTLSNQVYSCLNIENNTWLDENDITNIMKELPEIYAEVDKNDDFARIYIKGKVKGQNGCDCPADSECNCESSDIGEVVVDLDLTYPSSLSIPEPIEYRDFSEVIQDASINTYDTDVDN